MISPPTEISLILMPFETRLGELLNVAQTSSDSIRLWSEQIQQQQKKHIDLILHMSQIKVAKEQTLATRKNIQFQVAVIVFTLLLVILSQPIGTYVEKKLLEGAFVQKVDEEKKCLELRLENESKFLKTKNTLERELVLCTESLRQTPTKK